MPEEQTTSSDSTATEANGSEGAQTTDAVVEDKGEQAKGEEDKSFINAEDKGKDQSFANQQDQQTQVTDPIKFEDLKLPEGLDLERMSIKNARRLLRI